MIKLRDMTMFLVLVYSGIIVCLTGVTAGQNHAFIQVDKELKYLVDGVTVHMSDMLQGSGGSALLQGEEGGAMLDDRAASHRAPLAHKNYITFDPPHLDFKEHPVGMPVMRKVVVRNVGPYSSGGGQTAADAAAAAVQLHSLSGNTLHFHCTFFQDKVVSVFSNTTFDVVFLGREEGLIENTIFIHTSIGTYKYAVRAVGTSNPYRLRPLVGVRMPLNSSYAPVISLHNPHSYPIQVREMYSSGGDLHLELLKSTVEGEATHWRIPPYHTQPLARATFVARRENNHTAYIRIVTTGVEGDYLVVPVEVEVSSEPGLYCPSDGLHFPLLTPHHSTATLPLMLLNSAHKHILIQNVITTPVNDAITIDFKPIKIPPGTVKATQVATVTFDPSKVRRGGAIVGKLLVKSKVAAYKLSVPYSVNLQHGHLKYKPGITSFYTGPSHLDPAMTPSVSRRPASNTSNISEHPLAAAFPSAAAFASSSSSSSSLSSSSLSSSLSWSSSLSSSSSVSLLTPTSSDGTDSNSGDEMLLPAGEPRNLTLKNTFACSVVVYNVTLPQHHASHFRVMWRGEVVVREGGEGVVASLQLLSVGSHLRLTTHLTIHTNITSITIPIIAYNGRLTKHFSSGPVDWDTSSQEFGEESSAAAAGPHAVDLGTVGMGEKRHLQFYVLNENPVPLQLQGWAANVSWCQVDLVHDDKSKPPAGGHTTPTTVWLEPGTVRVFSLSVVTPSTEGMFWAAVSVTTRYETLSLTFKLRTAVGQLTMMPSPVLFDRAFPGKVSSVPLQVQSTFSHSMKVQDVLPLLPTQQFWYRGAADGEAYTLAPDTLTPIGTLHFDPKLHCHSRCYAGFLLTEKLGQQWSNSLALSGHVASTDDGLLSSLGERYNNITTPTFNTSLLLHTSHLHAFPFTVQVSLVWPRVVSPRELVFPLTQLYNSTVALVPLSNPTNTLLYAQLLFLNQYPSPHVLTQALAELHRRSDWSEEWEGGSSNRSSAFRLVDLDTSAGGSCAPQQGGPCHWGHVDADPAMASGISQHKRQVETDLANRVAKDTMVFRLGPGDQVDVRVSFRPVTVGWQHSVLLVRNNLTVVDAVVLRGAGGQGALKFANRKPDATPLLFIIGAQHLNDCLATAGGQVSRDPRLTVKKTFTARNTGDLPVTVSGFLIAGMPCESYGFKVIQCEAFTLQPNASRKIDIAFSPDFTLSRVQQSLHIVSDIGMAGQELVYTLQATIPATLLAACSSALPRPAWEPLLYYIVFTLLVIMLLATILIAMMDADILLKENANNMIAQHQSQGIDKVFDLRSIAVKDTKKLASASVSTANGHVANQDQPHQRHSSSIAAAKLGYNSNNRRASSNAVYISTNNNVISNGKYKACKHSNDYRSESVSRVINASTFDETKTKEHGYKSTTSNIIDNDEGPSNIALLLGLLSELCSWLWQCAVDIASSIRNAHHYKRSAPTEHNRRKKHNSGNNSTSKSNKDLHSHKTLPSSTHSNNNNSLGFCKPDVCDTASDKFNRYNKEFRSDHEYKYKDKTNRLNCIDRRSRKDSDYSKEEYNDEDSLSSSSKTSQKQRDHEEETSSCTTESSNSEDLSASDKDLSSKSESSSSPGGSNNIVYKNTKNSSNNSHKKATKTRSQSNLHSSGSSSASPSPDPAAADGATPSTVADITDNSAAKDAHEGAFEIAVRGKGIKRGKGCSVPVTDISADHCLELPYSPKTIKPPTLSSDSLLKRTKRRTVRIKSESSVPSSISGQSIRTTNTDINKIQNISNQNNCLPNNSSRSSSELQSLASRDSYSAKVMGHEKQKAKVTPVGKILPEIKRVLPQRSLGAIGQKITPPIAPYSHQPLAMFSQELPQHSPLQQFYTNPTPSLSSHSWDVKTVTPSLQPAGLPPPGLAAPDDWFFKQFQNNGNSSSNNNPSNGAGVWSSQLYQAPQPRPTPLPSSPTPWSNVNSSIWSSSNWNGAGTGLPSLWPASTHTAVSQGLGFDPVGGWPSAAHAADTQVPATGWPPKQHTSPQQCSPHKTKNV